MFSTIENVHNLFFYGNDGVQSERNPWFVKQIRTGFFAMSFVLLLLVYRTIEDILIFL